MQELLEKRKPDESRKEYSNTDEPSLKESSSLVPEGRMDTSPRALGNRSIIADPRSGDMCKKILI